MPLIFNLGGLGYASLGDPAVEFAVRRCLASRPHLPVRPPDDLFEPALIEPQAFGIDVEHPKVAIEEGEAFVHARQDSPSATFHTAKPVLDKVLRRDVGVDSKPAHHVARRIAHRLYASQKWTEDTVRPAQRERHLERLTRRYRMRPACNNQIKLCRVVDRLPAPALHLLRRRSTIVVPASIVPEDEAIAVRDPAKCRNIVGEQTTSRIVDMRRDPRRDFNRMGHFTPPVRRPKVRRRVRGIVHRYSPPVISQCKPRTQPFPYMRSDARAPAGAPSTQSPR